VESIFIENNENCFQFALKMESAAADN
jgi:hypothetical protein